MITRYSVHIFQPTSTVVSWLIILIFLSCSITPKQSNKTENAISQIDSPKAQIASIDSIETTISNIDQKAHKVAPKKEMVINYSVKEKTGNENHELINPKKSGDVEEKSAPKYEPAPLEMIATAQNKPALFLGSSWEKLLQKYVSPSGQVDYKNLKKNEAELAIAVDQLVSIMPDETWSRSEKLAYWINIYNAFTIKLVVGNYPLKKITDLDGGKTWDVKRIELGGKRYSLNQIENEIIRPQFKDARIHFAINCAAKSCPPLFNHAFVADKLEQQLESRTRLFILDEKFNRISSSSIELSRIFDWYAADFGDTKAFLKKYSNAKIPDLPIKFNDYDWTLNE